MSNLARSFGLAKSSTAGGIHLLTLTGLGKDCTIICSGSCIATPFNTYGDRPLYPPVHRSYHHSIPDGSAALRCPASAPCPPRPDLSGAVPCPSQLTRTVCPPSSTRWSGSTASSS